VQFLTKSSAFTYALFQDDGAKERSCQEYNAHLRAISQEYETRLAKNRHDFNEAVSKVQRDFKICLSGTGEMEQNLSKNDVRRHIDGVESDELGNPSSFKTFLDRAEQSLSETLNADSVSRLKEECQNLKIRCSHYEERIQDLEVLLHYFCTFVILLLCC
jgi:hypothetical protein